MKQKTNKYDQNSITIEHGVLSLREREIVEIVNKNEGCSVKELSRHFQVAEVTIRRDLSKLEARKLLFRLHGSAVPADQREGQSARGKALQDREASREDALILAPLHTEETHTLRERSLRNRIPFLAESCEQEGAIYLGPNNFEAGYRLGLWAGEYFKTTSNADAIAHVLDISEFDLPNTRDRSRGFSKGINEALADRAIIYSVDGRGLYSDAYQIALNALRITPSTNIVFGINDDSVLAGIQAYRSLRMPEQNLIAVNVGTEGETLLRALANDPLLVASAALFPEIVGRRAVDAVAHLWSDDSGLGDKISTPFALLTKDNFADYYKLKDDQWTLSEEMLPAAPGWVQESYQGIAGKEIAFVILHENHEWYRNVGIAMKQRANELGAKIKIKNRRDDLKVEVTELRRKIGQVAASLVKNGDSIILDAGSTTKFMAQQLRDHRDLTVITNSKDVFELLHTAPGITLLSTGGRYDPKSKSFVGRGAQLMLKSMRVDAAFIVADGVSPDFGISSVTSEEAEMRQVMIDAARDVVVLADHTVLSTESNYRVSGLQKANTLITDAGIRASQSMELSQLGLRVVVGSRFDEDEVKHGGNRPTPEDTGRLDNET